MYTNVSEHKVQAIFSHHKKTGKAVIPKCKKPSLYRKLQEDLQAFYFYFYFTACLILLMVYSISTKL